MYVVVLLRPFVICCCRDGSSITAAHDCSDFRFRTYAPTAFRYFRDMFKIPPADFLVYILTLSSFDCLWLLSYRGGHVCFVSCWFCICCLFVHGICTHCRTVMQLSNPRINDSLSVCLSVCLYVHVCVCVCFCSIHCVIIH